MKARVLLAFDQAFLKKPIWLAACSEISYEPTLQVFSRMLPDNYHTVEKLDTNWLNVGEDVIAFPGYIGINPLVHWRENLRQRLGTGGYFVTAGFYPDAFPPDLAEHSATVSVLIDYFYVVQLMRDKLTNREGWDDELTQKIIEQLPDLPPDVWEEMASQSHRLSALGDKIKTYLTGNRVRMPKTAFEFYEVYFPLIQRALSLDATVLDNVRALLGEPVSGKLEELTQPGRHFLSYDGTFADVSSAELVGCALGNQSMAKVIRVDLEKIRPEDLNFGQGLLLQMARALNHYVHFSADKVVLWIEGAESRKEVEAVVANLAHVFNVAVVFYNPVGDDTVSLPTGTDFTSTKKIEGERRTMITDSIVESWRRSGEELSYRIWKPVLVIGVIWLALSFLLNIIGTAPAFVGDNFFHAVGRMIREADAGTYFNLFVAVVMGFCMASAITALEIFGRTRMKDPFIFLLLVIAYVSGLALNYAGIQGSYEAASKMGSVSNDLAGFVRVIAAVATEFLPEQMIILAMEVGRKASGASGIDREAIPEQTRKTTTGQAKLVKVDVKDWSQKFKKAEHCSGPDCEKYTDNAVVTEIEDEEVVFAVCGRCRAQARANPNIMMEWDGVDVNKEKEPEEEES